MAGLKFSVTRYAALISVGLILTFSGYLAIADFSGKQTTLEDNSEAMISQVKDAIDGEIQKRVDILQLFKNSWDSAESIEDCYSLSRFEDRIPSYYNITPGFKAINWIDTNGTIRWLYPYEENIVVLNQSIVILKGNVFNTGFAYAQDTGNMGVIGIIELYQGGYGFTTYIPLFYNSTMTGYLNGVFDLNILFNEIFNPTYGFVGVNQYSVSVHFEDIRIFHQNEEFSDSDAFIVTRELSILDSFSLKLALRPLQNEIFKISIWKNWSIPVLGVSLAVVVGVLVNSLLKRNEMIRISSQERALLMQELHIKQKMESLGTLAGGIAHDFNNLLAGIQGNLSLIELNLNLLREGLDEGSNFKLISDIGTDLSDIQGIVQKSGKTINQITQFSHSSTSELNALNVKPLIYDLLKGFRKMIDRRISTVADLSEEEIYIFGDGSRFNQVLLNLCINARDAIGPHTGEIKISARLVPKRSTPKNPKRVDLSNHILNSSDFYDKNYELEIRVLDTGEGIPVDIQQKIYDPFFTTKSKHRQGTGLGLTIVYNTIESMDGSISVKSEVGKGSTFILHFPIISIGNVPQITPPKIDGIDLQTKFDFSTNIFLIIEDEKLIRASMQKYFENSGATIFSAKHGKKGLNLYMSFPKQFDLVILDINLPGMNGIDVYRKIKKTFPSQPILFITGFSNFGIPPRDQYDLGVITKPFKLPELANKINNYFRKKTN